MNDEEYIDKYVEDKRLNVLNKISLKERSKSSQNKLSPIK